MAYRIYTIGQTKKSAITSGPLVNFSVVRETRLGIGLNITCRDILSSTAAGGALNEPMEGFAPSKSRIPSLVSHCATGSLLSVYHKKRGIGRKLRRSVVVSALVFIGLIWFMVRAEAANVNFTVAAWVNPNSSIATKGLVVKNNEIRLVTDASGNPGCQFHNGTDWQSAATSTTALVTDTWAHVACAYDGENVRVYVDGERTASEGVTADVQNTANVWRFGDDAGGTYGDYNGRMDEVRIYNRALSPREVRDLYEWAPGPVAHWKMDEKVKGDSKTLYNTAATSTLGLLDGTTVDGANNTGMDCTVRGKYGGACEFDGVDDYVDVGTTIDPPENNITISAWVYWGGTNGDYQVLVAKRDTWSSTDMRWQITGNHRDNNTVFWQRSGVNIDFGVSLSQNVWQHITVIQDDANSKLYLDGVLKSMQSALSFGTDSNAKVIIGGEQPSGVESFNGLIDDVRIYDYALTQKQIMAVMGGGGPGVTPLGPPLHKGGEIGPVGYWKFDEGFGTTAFDSSSQGNTGTYTGNASSTPSAGRLGRGMALDGTGDYITVSDSAGISFAASSLTFSAWANPTSLASDSAVLAKNSEYRMVVDTNGQPGCQIHNGTDWQSAATSTADVLSTSSWKHITCTYDGTNAIIYVDGQERAKQALSSMSNDTSNALRIGDDASGAFGEFTGSIDEVKIYNYALTQDEVTLEYNQGKSVKWGSLSTDSDGVTASDAASREYCIPGDTSTCRAPVGEWKFDERVSGDSQTLYDTSGNSNDGTSVDGANNTGMDCSVRGKIGRACEFDGVDDYVSVADDASLTFGDGLSTDTGVTMSAWIKMDDATSFQIIDKAKSTDAAVWEYRFYVDVSNNLYFQLFDNTSGSQIYITGTDDLSSYEGRWLYVTVVYDGSSAKEGLTFYLDGNTAAATRGLDSNQGVYAAMHNGPEPVLIGTRSFSPVYADGLIDQVRIYDYARTAAQVAWEYNRGKPVGWWKLDEGQGDTVYDSSGNKNHGTLTIGSAGSQTATTTAWTNGATGKRNGSLSFDGTDDWVSVGDTDGLSFGDGTNDRPFSISAWVKMNDATKFRIFSKATQPGVNTNEYLFTGTGSDKLGLALYDDDTDTIQQLTILSDSTITNDEGEWHFYSATYDGSGNTSGLMLYRDGKLFSGTATKGASYTAMANTSATAGIGIFSKDNGTYLTYADGQIDDVRIWNYALTPEQIKMEYNQGAINFGPSTGTP